MRPSASWSSSVRTGECAGGLLNLFSKCQKGCVSELKASTQYTNIIYVRADRKSKFRCPATPLLTFSVVTSSSVTLSTVTLHNFANPEYTVPQESRPGRTVHWSWMTCMTRAPSSSGRSPTMMAACPSRSTSSRRWTWILVGRHY